MKSKIFDIYNLYFHGEKNIEDEKGQYLGLTEIILPKLGKAKIQIMREYINNTKSPAFRKTGTLTIELNNEVNEDHSSIAQDICSLLSFALNGHIEYLEQRDKRSIFRETGMTSHGGWMSIIINRSGHCISIFILACWDAYRAEKNARRLHETIRLLAQTNESKDFLEQKIALTSVLLENLKHTYGVNNKNYKKDRNQFYKKPKMKGDKCLAFKAIIEDMINEVNMPLDFKYDLTYLVNNRNKIIHQGLLDCSPHVMWEQYEAMVSFIRIYLLSLLNFKGHYYSFDEPEALRTMGLEIQ